MVLVLNCQAGFKLRQRSRKRAAGTRKPLETPTRPNECWSLDFLSDVLEPGRRFRIFAVVDNCTKENLALISDTSLSGARVTRELDANIRLYGRPKTIISDNGTELTSRAILEWQNGQTNSFDGVSWHHIQPGKPAQNAFIESSMADCVMSC